MLVPSQTSRCGDRALRGSFGALTLAALLATSRPVAAEEPIQRRTAVADRAASVLDGLALAAHRARRMSSYTFLGVGLTFTGVGLVAELEYEKSYGGTLWVTGAGGALGGAIALLTSSSIERFADEQGAGAAGYSPERLEAAWRSRVDDERSRRITWGVINLGFAALFLGASGALLAGVGDIDRAERGSWVVTTGLSGGANLSAGLLSLLIESDLERGFAIAYGGGDVTSLRIDVGVAPVRGGGALQLLGTF